MSLVRLPKPRKDLDRLVIERSLAQAIYNDLPEYYSRLHEIALQGEDSDALRAITTMIDRLVGKPKDENAIPKQNLTINVVNPSGGSLNDYKISRYSKEMGGEDVTEADFTPKTATPSISSLPPIENV